MDITILLMEDIDTLITLNEEITEREYIESLEQELAEEIDNTSNYPFNCV